MHETTCCGFESVLYERGTSAEAEVGTSEAAGVGVGLWRKAERAGAV